MEERKEIEDCLLVSLASMANRVVVTTLSLMQVAYTKGWDQEQAAREDWLTFKGIGTGKIRG